MHLSSMKKREHVYKVLVIGGYGTGKTSIVKRYVHNFFSKNYRATVGVDFALKVLNWDASTLIKLQLWDISGQERYRSMTRVYYKDAVGCLIVFDVTRQLTFEEVSKWKHDLDSKVQLANGQPIPCVLLANKCDMPKEGVVNNTSQIDEYCANNGFLAWYETSAKENINIEEAVNFLVKKIFENNKVREYSTPSDDKDEKIDLRQQSQQKKSGGCCS